MSGPEPKGRLRTRATLYFLLTALPAAMVSGAAVVVLDRLIAQEIAARTQEIVRQADRVMKDEGKRVRRAVEQLAELEEIRQLAASIEDPSAIERAEGLASGRAGAAGLDLFAIVAGAGPRQGEIVSSAHLPDAVGDPGPRFLAKITGAASGVAHELVEGNPPETVPAMIAVVPVERDGRAALYLYGGSRLDGPQLSSIARMAGATLILTSPPLPPQIFPEHSDPGRPGTPIALAEIPGAAEGKSRIDVVVHSPRLEAARTTFFTLSVVLVGASLLVALVSGRLLSSRITGPILELSDAAREVGRGNLGVRIEPSSNDEVGALGEVFNDMIVELQDSRERLARAERIAAWREIARRVAHEIKNPLFPIQVSIETLKKSYDKKHPKLDEIVAESTRTVLEEVRALNRIVTEFSEFARLPAPVREPSSVPELLAHVAGLYKDGGAGGARVAFDWAALEARRLPEILDRPRAGRPRADQPGEERARGDGSDRRDGAAGGAGRARRRRDQRDGRRSGDAGRGPGEAVHALFHHQGDRHRAGAGHRRPDRVRARGQRRRHLRARARDDVSDLAAGRLTSGFAAWRVFATSSPTPCGARLRGMVAYGAYSVDGIYDEMFDAPGKPRMGCEQLFDRLARLEPDHLIQRQQAAELAMLNLGITFNVYGHEAGTEKIFPFDIIPRVLAAGEWRGLEAGLVQRIEALNLFVDDVYHEQKILKDGVVPRELVESSSGYLPACRGLDPPRRVWIHVTGTDLVRDQNGTFYVLEDNLRCPSGVSYVLENRAIMKRTFPQVFANMQVRPVQEYPGKLLEMLQAINPRQEVPHVVLLTPGVYNSAYFEHSFLAQQMGIELVEGRDLVVSDGYVKMRTTRGLKRVDVIYRRIDDTFIDPKAFRPESVLGVPGLLDVYRAGRLGLANAPGTGIADDKVLYAYAPEIIRYYLDQDPIIPNVPTYLCWRPEDLEYVVGHLDELVVKAADQSGGYGMLIGPHASQAERDDFRDKIRKTPRAYIAQPTLRLSTVPTLVGGTLEARHVDLRPYILYGQGIWVMPGGLTRVALRKGSLVVNSSQGGGSKDTWVLDGSEQEQEQSQC